MKTPKHLFTAHDIANAIGRNFNATMEFLKLHDIKPVREIRTNSMTYRQYSKSAMNEAISIADATLKRRKKATPAPVQAPLPFTQDEAQAVREAATRAKEAMAGVDIDKVHEPVTATLPKMPDFDITVMETKHAEEMLAVMRSIDDKLGQLLSLWK